jgi:6-phosphogluconolactonase
MADLFRHDVAEALTKNNSISIAFSGGNTPKVFFEQLATEPHAVPWDKIHIFWTDERCVPPDHADSNFGMTNKSLLRKLNTIPVNIHRIAGENDPPYEANRYSDEIRSYVTLKDGLPVFDWIFLGIGDDGHTASIFPDRMDLFHTDDLCAVVKHPQSGQARITLTGRSILNAQRISFMANGETKSLVLKDIFDRNLKATFYPAFHIQSSHSNVDWFMDMEAAKYLNITCHG